MAKNSIKQLENGLILHIPWIVSGTTYYDISGNGNNGSATSVTKTRTLSQDVMGFNGSSSNIQLTNLTTWSTWITMSFWMNVWSNTSQVGCPISDDYDQWGTQDIATAEFFANWGAFWSRVYQVGQGPWAWTTVTAWTIVANTWYHITVTAASWGTMYLYVDWKVIWSAAFSWTLADKTATWYLWKRGTWVTPYYFSWRLSNVRIYNRALSSTEINLIRNSEYIK